jgi:cytochrome c oxidase assembly factor CtaG
MQVVAHLGAGAFAPLQIGGVTLIGTMYALRCVSLTHQHRAPPPWRVVSFYGGLALIVVAFVSPLAHVGEELVYVHMIQHLVIGDVAALLMVLGFTRAILQPVLALPLVGRLQALAFPAVALPLWIANLFLWHVPALYEGAVQHDALHALQHLCFIGFGIALWMPVVGPLPMPRWFGGGAQLTYTAIARLAAAALGNFLMWSGAVLYPVYATGERYWGVDPLTDQGIAGAIMMAEGLVVTLGVLAWLLLRWAERDTEKQRLLDLAYERGIQLDDARAERAVAAGHGGRLERRLKEQA